jgi:hypothetical protein
VFEVVASEIVIVTALGINGNGISSASRWESSLTVLNSTK